jgi:tRNA U34 5-carboxymethylaminomethyl modifying enzyme MnmG/GidA
VYRGRSHFDPAVFGVELQRIEKALASLGETMESVYDEAYIGQKTEGLRRAGIAHERIQIDPQDFSIN